MSKTLPNTKIEPLVNDLKKLNIGYYLISNYFKKYCVKAGIDELWGEVFSEAENNRNYYSVGFNHEPHDIIIVRIKVTYLFLLKTPYIIIVNLTNVVLIQVVL